MTDADNDIPPGHTRKPLRQVGPTTRKIALSWPKFGTMFWPVVGAICAASVLAGLSTTPTDQTNLWVVVAIGAVAMSVASGHEDRPDVSEFRLAKLFDLAVYGFKYALFSMFASLPGLYLGVALRDAFRSST